jgi:hypothetical protein
VRTGYAVALPSPYESAPEIQLIFDAAADHPSVARLVRALDDDLAARYPDEPCTGGTHLRPAIRFLLAEADGRPIGCCAVQPFPAPDSAAELKRVEGPLLGSGSTPAPQDASRTRDSGYRRCRATTTGLRPLASG